MLRLYSAISIFFVCRIFLACIVFVIATQAHAVDAVPDINAKEQLLQQERERALRQEQQKSPDVRLDQPLIADTLQSIPQNESPCFTIDRITLLGDASERFQWALHAPSVNIEKVIHQCLGTQGINVVMKRIQNAIIARGYITTRVLAGPQDIKTGELHLTLIPGHIHAIRFEANTSEHATGWNALPAKVGDILNLRDIEQGLENLKRIPTVDADIQIEAPNSTDAAPGDSDLVVRWKQRAIPLRLSLSVDNSGVKSTGKYQGAMTVSGDNLLSLNDLFYVSLNHDLGGGDEGDRGTRGHAIHYSVPYGDWLLGFNTSEYNYHQSVAGLNQTYLYEGKSTNTDAKLSRMVWRDATRKVTLSGKLWLRTSSNFINDTEVNVQHRRMAGWEFAVNDREYLGSATLDATLAYRQGTGAFGSIPAPEEAFGEGTSRPRLVTADVQFNQPFHIASQRFTYALAARAQANQTALVPQDRFAIGGFYTVRGFDGESILSADRGLLLRNDLSVALADTGQSAYVALDYGQVGGQSAANLIGQHLAGAALGVRGGFSGVSYDLFASVPVMKPQGFVTSGSTIGFNINWSY
jgi:hemolysin activation/secretion protein